MRNNPRHSGAAVERLASHQRAKDQAAGKETAERERLLAYEQAPRWHVDVWRHCAAQRWLRAPDDAPSPVIRGRWQV